MNKVLRATLVSAVVITTVIGIASFVLSFAALWDLATMAGVPRQLSWLWPVIVDGTILQATISVIALAQFEDQRSGRRFFWGVLITAALVSIGANAMHAFISNAGTLHPAVSAAIATVAPVSLLAATHGLGILVRVPSELPVTALERGREADAEPSPRPEPKLLPEPSRQPEPELMPEPEPESKLLPEPQLRPESRLEPEPRPSPKPFSEPEPLPEPFPKMQHQPRETEPLNEVDRWILDEERAEDLYPVDAP